MKYLMSLVLISVFTSFSWAGVGGTSGGHVFFQKVSTYVSVVYNRTLCVEDGNYFALVNFCIEQDREGGCERFEKKEITQPVISSHKVCAKQRGDTCAKWETAPYVQKPIFNVIDDNGGGFKRPQVIQVPNCR